MAFVITPRFDDNTIISSKAQYESEGVSPQIELLALARMVNTNDTAVARPCTFIVIFNERLLMNCGGRAVVCVRRVATDR